MTDQSFRLPGGRRGSTARKPVGFTFNGTALSGDTPGDTLASALLANGVHLVGPRLQVSPAPGHRVRRCTEEPNALVQLGNDPGRT